MKRVRLNVRIQSGGDAMIFSQETNAMTKSLRVFLSASLFINLLTGVAFAASPVILSPAGDLSVNEGETLVIPFQVDEPDNEPVDYSVEYLVGGVVQPNLPPGAQLHTGPNTVEKTFFWQTRFDQAGTHSFRFRAKDDMGSETLKTIAVTVNNKTGAPGAHILHTVDVGALTLSKPVVPGDTVAVNYEIGRPQLITVGFLDPEGDSITIQEIQGFPGAQFSSDNKGQAIWTLNMGSIPLDGSTQEGIVRGTDSNGNAFDVRLKLEFRRIDNEDLFKFPVLTIDGFEPTVALRGTVKLNHYLRNHFSFRFPNAQKNTIVQYMRLVRPGDWESLCPPIPGTQDFLWDTTTVPDGMQVLALKIVDSDPVDFPSFKMYPMGVEVDNNPGVDQPQKLHDVYGSHAGRTGWRGVDEIPYNGLPQKVGHPYPYRPVAPAYNRPEDPSHWLSNHRVETLVGNVHGHYETRQLVFQRKNGLPFLAQVYQQHGVTEKHALPHVLREPLIDGPRNVNILTPYATYRPIPGPTPGFYGIDISGRLYRVDMDGTVTTLAGWVTRSDVLPYWIGDTTIPTSEFFTHQRALRGSFPEANKLVWSMPIDLVVDTRPGRQHLVYVADTANHRITVTDLNTGITTTFAGTPGAPGNLNGPALTAKFNEPYTIETDGAGSFFVGDRLNNAIRKIAPDGTVTTLASGAVVDQNLLDPFCIRSDSLGNLIVYDVNNARVLRVDPNSGSVFVVMSGLTGAGQDSWAWLDVDKFGPACQDQSRAQCAGSVGPKDAILIVGSRGGGNHYAERFTKDGLPLQRENTSEGYGPRLLEEVHYTWAIAIDDEEGRYLFTGFGSDGINEHRLTHSDDPPLVDRRGGTGQDRLYMRGWNVYSNGSVGGFPGSVSDRAICLGSLYSRPSFSGLYGSSGHSGTGTTNLDDLSNLSNADLLRFFQNGAEGSVPRPEISGEDGLALVYFLRVNMVDAEVNWVDHQQIKSDLIGAGLYASDTRRPEIRRVSVSEIDNAVSGYTDALIRWQTDEPTIGYVAYGRTDYYGATSSIEGDFGKDHAMRVTMLPKGKTVHFSIVARDRQGNPATLTRDALLSGPPEVDDNELPILSDITATQITSIGAKITWKSNEPANSRVNFGLSASYGQTVSDLGSYVLDHSVALTGLTPGTLYHFRVASSDFHGNLAVSGDFTFTTGTNANNESPLVDVGPNKSVLLTDGIHLKGTVTDDGNPNPPGRVNTTWDKMSGPGAVTFLNPSAVDTHASFTDVGTYVLRLYGDDGDINAWDEVTVLVYASGSPPPTPPDAGGGEPPAGQSELKRTLVDKNGAAKIPCDGEMTIFGRRGETIASLRGAGGYASWDGMNDNGERVANGVYLGVCSEKFKRWKIAVVR